jgi:hypothetical protein
VHPIEADVIALPSRPAFDDAEFSEPPPVIARVDSARANAARRAWEASIPQILNPVRPAAIAESKLGAPSPRRDFRRLGSRRKQAARAHAALAFAVIAVLGGGAFVASLAATTASHMQAAAAKTEMGSGVSLSSATEDAVGLDDIAPETPPQIGYRGAEPPSARTVHRAAYEPGS